MKTISDALTFINTKYGSLVLLVKSKEANRQIKRIDEHITLVKFNEIEKIVKENYMHNSSIGAKYISRNTLKKILESIKDFEVNLIPDEKRDKEYIKTFEKGRAFERNMLITRIANLFTHDKWKELEKKKED